MRWLRNRVSSPFVAAIALGTIAMGGVSRADLVGPTPYLSFDDSPFQGGSFSYFYLENFEDLALNTPGVTANTGAVFGDGALFDTSTDSVDGDDGAIDGSGSRGHSFGVSFGNPALAFTFDEDVLGLLPTHVGIVFTDGFNPSSFEAFDAGGLSLGVFGPYNFFASPATQVQGATAEDTFVGFINAGGISRIVASTTGQGGLEVDHLQYGRMGTTAVPEPASILGLGLGSLAIAGRRSWARKRHSKRIRAAH